MLSLKQNNVRQIAILALFFLVLLPVVFPLFHKGFFVSDDGEWMIIRLSAFFESFRDGQIPTRLLQRLNEGYGYPVANFLYPGFLYLGVLIHLLGFSFTNTIKVLLGASIVLSSYFTYLWIRKFFDSVSSFAGGVVYSYLPYHLFDLYKRGSVGEILSLAVFPFVLWQLERKSLFWTSLGIALLIISHNTLAAFFLGFLLLYALLDILILKEKKTVILYSEIFLLGIGVASFFWIPAISDLSYTVFSRTNISNWANYFADIWLVGLESYVVFTITLILFFLRRVKASKHRLTILMLFIGLLSTFFATPSSSIFWNILPVSFVQFPFRFLSVTIVCVAFLTAFIISVSRKRERFVITTIFVLLLTSSLWLRLSGIQYIDKPESFYSTNLDTTTVHSEYMPIFAKQVPSKWETEKVTTLDGKIESVTASNNQISFVTSSGSRGSYTVQKNYFPGWVASIDGNTTSLHYGNNQGLIVISVPPGRHSVRVFYSETTLHLISDLLSVASFLVLIGLTFFPFLKSK